MGFGKKVIGAEAAAKNAAKKKGKAGFGPRVTGRSGVNVPEMTTIRPLGSKKPVKETVVETVPASVPATVDSLSIEQVKAILAENPAFIETVHVQELERPEGPRREALLAIQASASAQGLEDIFLEVEQLMTEMGAAPEVKPVEPVVDGEGGQSIVIPTDFNELKALAKEHEVDLVKNRSKVDITAALVQALVAKNITVQSPE